MNEKEDGSNQSGDDVCPECGNEFKNQHGMRIHYANSHEGNLYTTQECEWCSDEFRKRPGADRVFCSHECRGKRRSAEGLPGRSRQVTLTCELCGTEFSRARSNVTDGKNYCSVECHNNDSDAEWLECEWCSEEFRAHGKYVNEARFCSQDCYGEWLSENGRGEDAPAWKGGYTLPSEGWLKLRRECLEEHDYRCQGCGVHQDQNREDHGVGLAVHHIQPRTSFDDPTDADTVDNLVPLCRDCHDEWEGVPVRPELTD